MCVQMKIISLNLQGIQYNFQMDLLQTNSNLIIISIMTSSHHHFIKINFQIFSRILVLQIALKEMNKFCLQLPPKLKQIQGQQFISIYLNKSYKNQQTSLAKYSASLLTAIQIQIISGNKIIYCGRDQFEYWKPQGFKPPCPIRLYQYVRSNRGFQRIYIFSTNAGCQRLDQTNIKNDFPQYCLPNLFYFIFYQQQISFPSYELFLHSHFHINYDSGFPDDQNLQSLLQNISKYSGFQLPFENITYFNKNPSSLRALYENLQNGGKIGVIAPLGGAGVYNPQKTLFGQSASGFSQHMQYIRS